MMKKKRQLEATLKLSTLCSEQNNAADSLHIESRNIISDYLTFYNMLVELEAVEKNDHRLVSTSMPNYNLGDFFMFANIIGVEPTLFTSTSQHCPTLTP